MLYKVNAVAIRPLHEWTSTFERLWKHQLLRIKERAEANNAQKQQSCGISNEEENREFTRTIAGSDNDPRSGGD